MKKFRNFMTYTFKNSGRLLLLIMIPIIGFCLSCFIAKYRFLLVNDPSTILLAAVESISTVFIVVVAWRQGRISNQLMHIELRRDRVETEPRVICVKGDGATYHYDSLKPQSFLHAQPIDFGRDPGSTITYGLKLTFLNATNNTVVLRYDGSTLHSEMMTNCDNIMKEYLPKEIPTSIVLKPLEEIQYIFLGDPSTFIGMRYKYFLVQFELQNYIGDTYIEGILIHVDWINPKQQEGIDDTYKMTIMKHSISLVTFQ